MASREVWGAHVRNSPSPAYLCAPRWGPPGLAHVQGTLACVPCSWKLGGHWACGAEQGCYPSIPSTSQLVPEGASRGNSSFWCGCDFISAGPRAPALGGLQPVAHTVLGQSHPAQGGVQGCRGAGVQGWAMPSIFSARVLWVPVDALVPEWLPDGVLDPPGLGLGADSWARLVPGGSADGCALCLG